MARAHVLITGKVQGVFYRDSCISEARRHGVTGWVRNLTDGRVEALFQGEPDAVKALINWCHDGSPRAEVRHVDVNWEDKEEAFEDFEKRSTAEV